MSVYDRPDNFAIFCMRYGIEKCDSDENRPIEVMKRAARVGDWATIVDLMNALAANGRYLVFNMCPFQTECAIIHVGVEDCKQRLRALSFAKMRTYIVYFVCWCRSIDELTGLTPRQVLELAEFFIWRLIWNGKEYMLMPVGNWAKQVIINELGQELEEAVARGAAILLLQYGRSVGSHRAIMEVYEKSSEVPEGMTIDEYELKKLAEHMAEQLEKKGCTSLAERIRKKIQQATTTQPAGDGGT